MSQSLEQNTVPQVGPKKLPRLGVVTAIGAVLLVLLLPLILRFRQSLLLESDRRNLQNVCLALLNYEAAYKKLPLPSATNSQGEQVWSWRIAVLPYLYEDADRELHRKINFQNMQPWDSPSNPVLQQASPKIFQSARAGHGSGSRLCNIFVISAPMRGSVTPVFVDGTQAELRRFTDGPSNTILAIMLAKHSSEWASPATLSIDEAYSLIQKEDGKVLCVFGDLKTGYLPVNIDRKAFEALLTPDGGEPVLVPSESH